MFILLQSESVFLPHYVHGVYSQVKLHYIAATLHYIANTVCCTKLRRGVARQPCLWELTFGLGDAACTRSSGTTII